MGQKEMYQRLYGVSSGGDKYKMKQDQTILWELKVCQTEDFCLLSKLCFFVVVLRFLEKSIEYYMSLPYPIEIIPDAEEGGVALRCPELPGCVTCAENLDVGYAMLEDAKRAWFLSCLEQGMGIPTPTQGNSY